MKIVKRQPDMTDQTLDNNMQGRINKMFSNQDLPAYTSLSEVTAMKEHIQELEKKVLALSIPTSMQKDGELPPAIGPSPRNQGNPGWTSSGMDVIEPQETTVQKPGFLRGLLSAPTFGDLAKNRIASLQHKILLGLFFTGVLALIILIATWSPTSTITSLIILVVDLVVLVVTFLFQ